jgi:hypothetical protein
LFPPPRALLRPTWKLEFEAAGCPDAKRPGAEQPTRWGVTRDVAVVVSEEVEALDKVIKREEDHAR